MKSIDVVILCYNAEKHLSDCVRSVHSQAVDGLRVIIIDNASTDGSVEVARRLAAGDSRIEVVCHSRNLGQHASFNEGVDLARGDYFMILCADDLLAQGSLRRATEALESNPDAAFALGADLKWFNGEPFAEPRQPGGWRVTDGTRFIGDCCRHSGFSLALAFVLVRTSAQKAAGHYRTSLPYTDDLEMALRLAGLGSVIEFEGALGIRREHPAQQSVTDFAGERTQLKQLKERMAAFDSFFGLEGRDVREAAHLHGTARLRIAEVAIRSAARSFFEGSLVRRQQ
jgi:GT2 family glycosyltransferase